MKKLLISALILSAGAATAQNRQIVSTECRREIVQLCGMNRDQIRSCLREKYGQLSQGCSGEVAARVRQRMEGTERGTSPRRKGQPSALGAVEHSYGRDQMQKVDFYSAPGGGRKPLIIFVHGGGWKHGDKGNATGHEKVSHYRGLGYHFASVNYRLVPENSVEQQAADVAQAIAYLVSKAPELNVDQSRVILMGHSAGAHLSALVGTDPQYLRAAGRGLETLSGVVPIDGAAYDVPKQLVSGNRIMQGTYKEAFGTNPTRQRALSPYHHAAGPNAPSFLILHADREDGKQQSEALATALRRAGTKVQLNGFEGSGMQGHREINIRLGDPTYPATAVVDAWLKTL